MIFLTTGTQLPFDRLVRALDVWAAENPLSEGVAQIGAGSYQPRHLDWVRTVDAVEFQKRMTACDTVVGHAGMGTIISALELGKRVVVMPRRAELGEHRNDHQLATASRLKHLDGLQVVNTADELAAVLSVKATAVEPGGLKTDSNLIRFIREFSGLEVA